MNDKQFNDFVLQSGLVLGLVYGITTFITYFMGVSVMVSWWVGLFFIGLAIGAPIYYGVKWRQFKEGYLEFKPAFMVIFLISALGGLISTIFNFALYTIIDPDLPEVLFNEALESTVSLLERMGTPEADIDETIEKMQSEQREYGVIAALEGYGYSLLLGAFIALVGGAIIRKNPPVFGE
ncbi:MAG: DUF4199 domain-containing protein [Flavobacteriales bacterium]|nr:DUF4199 domain-containing protein [Flavobacteriales bacterium]